MTLTVKKGIEIPMQTLPTPTEEVFKVYEPCLIWCKQEESANGSFQGSFSRRFSLACSRLRGSRVCEIEKG